MLLRVLQSLLLDLRSTQSLGNALGSHAELCHALACELHIRCKMRNCGNCANSLLPADDVFADCFKLLTACFDSQTIASIANLWNLAQNVFQVVGTINRVLETIFGLYFVPG
jgi:hypothetical protein